MKKLIFLTVVFIIMLAGWAFGQEASITVQCVQGLKNGTFDTLIAGHQVFFEITFTNGYNARSLFANGFVLESPDDAHWSNIDFGMVSPHPPGMDCVPGCFEPMIYPGPDPYSDWDGISPDYFGAVAYTTFGPGWVHGPTYGYTGPMPWSYPSFYLTFYLDLEQVGKHLVFDKATWTGVSWVWSQLEANPGPTVNVNPA